ncbi:MAG: glycosyltransferase family 4 protein [Bacteroidales bacterium]|nr:glycosyltransferase family 4 protein [Bacteroidales bacterium]
MKRILFIAPHRLNRAPSQRFRFEQYLNYFKEKGYFYDFSPLVSEKDDKIFYSKGNYINKFFLFLKYFFRRLKDVILSNRYDIVYIQREMFFLGPAFFEFLLSLTKAKIIYDFDDSIWLPNVSEANKNLNWLKSFSKIKKAIGYANLVFAGNDYLRKFALNYNKNVVIIPTTINTEEYVKQKINRNDDVVCIGWSGSITTIQHFKFAEPFLKKVKEKYGDRISIKVIGDKNYKNNELDVKALDWIKKDELLELSSFDIGIMPLPDDEWASGKCGLKGLQYMALGIPTIMSPVGVNKEIIQDGENGFLASEEQSWIDKISMLIESKTLREEMGLKARATVVEKYSFNAYKDVYLAHFENLNI